MLNGIRNKSINMDTLLTITSIIKEGDLIRLVGYVDHKEGFSKAIVQFFLIMHMCIIVKRANYKNAMVRKEKNKKKKK